MLFASWRLGGILGSQTEQVSLLTAIECFPILT